jgi:hypothetical protein
VVVVVAKVMMMVGRLVRWEVEVEDEVESDWSLFGV